MTAIYALSHFAVDLGCAYAVFSGSTVGAMGYLLYNFFAFAVQMPLGLLADRFGKNRFFAAAGTVLVALICLVVTLSIPGWIPIGLGLFIPLLALNGKNLLSLCRLLLQQLKNRTGRASQ